jgi:hypothetical protein
MIYLMVIAFITRSICHDLRKVLQVSRHGNRAPGTIFSHLVAEGYEDKNFPQDSDMQLHSSADAQIRSMARMIKERYGKTFSFSDATFYKIQSTDTSRTKETAMIQANEIFGQ